MSSVERCRVGEESVWDPSCVGEVRCCAMSGFEQDLGLFVWEDPIRDAAWCRGALCVSGCGGETLVVIYGIFGDIGVSPTADNLRRG